MDKGVIVPVNQGKFSVLPEPKKEPATAK
jgi:hypothetical protein